jgi:hypothetical protein
MDWVAWPLWIGMCIMVRSCLWHWRLILWLRHKYRCSEHITCQRLLVDYCWLCMHSHHCYFAKMLSKACINDEQEMVPSTYLRRKIVSCSFLFIRTSCIHMIQGKAHTLSCVYPL